MELVTDTASTEYVIWWHTMNYIVLINKKCDALMMLIRYTDQVSGNQEDKLL